MIERIRTRDGGVYDRDHGPLPVERPERLDAGHLCVPVSEAARLRQLEREKKARWRAKAAS